MNDQYKEPIVLEWRLLQGSAGMAAQMSHAEIKGQLKRICEQHGIVTPKWATTDDPYRVRIYIDQKLYTILCLQWENKKEWYRWRRVSEFTL